MEMAEGTSRLQYGQSQGTGQTQGIARLQHTEGTVARSIEQQTAKLPSDLFL
jgi:hypothetical protein